MIEKLTKYSITLIYLIPILLISGPFLPDFSISLVCVFFLIIVFVKKEFDIFNNIYFKLFILFCLYVCIRSLFTQDWLSIKSGVFYFRFGLFSTAVFFFLKNKKICLRKVLYVLLFCLTLLTIDSLIQFSTGKNILGMEIVDPARVSSFFGKELILGSFSFRVLLLIIPLLVFFKVRERFIFLAFLFLILITFLSSERTSVFFIICFVITYYIVSPINLRLKFAYLLIIIFAIVSLLNLSTPHKERLIKATAKSTSNFNQIPKMHLDHYTSGYRMFQNNNIFGVGPKMFRIECQNKAINYGLIFFCSTHPHNIVIQFLSEIGLVGLAFLLLFYFFLLKIFILFFFGKKKLEFYIFLNSLIVFINFFPLLPFGNFFNNWLSISNYLSISILFFLYNKNFNHNNLNDN